MALKPQLSFSSGELDPILHDRVTLERFQNGLATARNVMIGKSGTIKSRFGRFHFHKAASDNKPIRIYCPPTSNVVLEFGLDDFSASYVKVYDFSGNILQTIAGGATFAFTEAELDKLQFVTSGDYVYVFKGSVYGSYVFNIQVVTPYASLSGSNLFSIPNCPYSAISLTVTATGYVVDFAFTAVINGQETQPHYYANAALKKPILAGEDIVITLTIVAAGAVAADLTQYNEIRFYQRPVDGSAYGYLGRTTNIYLDAGAIKAKFTDIGGNPDYSNSIPSLSVNDGLSDLTNIGLHKIGTGSVYQQRLLLANFIDYNKEAILASRPGFKENFYRDYPYSADSALNFKAGTSGNARVLRIVESDGLVVFTTAGVFVSVGVLSPDNIALHKRGNWIIDEDIPPLAIPGGLFFVDKTTSTVRQLVYSQELAGYDSVDQSIFSDHLFKTRTITSWCFQQGTSPMIIVTFSDGTFATFTYSFEHQMRAWTRHDSVYPVEQVEGSDVADTSFFVINKDGVRYIEGTVPRAIASSIYSTNPEAHLLTYSAFMDSMKIKVDLLNDDLVGTDVFVMTPITPDDWEGTFTLTCGTSGLFPNTANLGAVGTIFRFFNPSDKTKLDLEVISRTDDNTVIVQPTEEFPEEYASGFRLYLTHTIVDGLSHLEGELVSIIADGDVLSSPYNNNNEEAPTYSVVQFGEIDLDVFHNYRSAITIVGRPIVADIKTLNVSTVEQSPTTLESLTVNKLYVRVHESRGLYVDNVFPEEKINEVDGTSVADMQSLDEYYVPSMTSIIGNRSKPAVSKRIEVTLPGAWDSSGQVSFRQVDPLHFEILSIIADIEILKRSDR